MSDKYLRPEDVAEMFGLSRPKVLRYCNAGKFPHLRFGQEVRFTAEHVEQIRTAHEVAPRPEAEQVDPWGHRGRRAS